MLCLNVRALAIIFHLEQLDLITASGRQQMEYLSYFVPKEKIVFLPLGIDTEFYHPCLDNNSRFGVNPVMLHVGNNRRDFATLKKVFMLVQKKISDVKLELVGGKSAKELFTGLKNITFHPGIAFLFSKSKDNFLKLKDGLWKLKM